MTIPDFQGLPKSNSTCRSPFQQHLQVAIPSVLSERHSKSFPTPPNQMPSKILYNYMPWVRFVVISSCCVLVAVGSGFVIFGTGCDRVRFSAIVGTIWLQYGPFGCSRDYFPLPPLSVRLACVTPSTLNPTCQLQAMIYLCAPRPARGGHAIAFIIRHNHPFYGYRGCSR